MVWDITQSITIKTLFLEKKDLEKYLKSSDAVEKIIDDYIEHVKKIDE